MTSEWFSDEGVVYRMILRPLPPNETPYPRLRYYYDYAPQSFNLPFTCSELELAYCWLCSIPALPPTREPVNQLTGKGHILFGSDRNGNDEIYVMDADGTIY